MDELSAIRSLMKIALDSAMDKREELNALDEKRAELVKELELVELQYHILERAQEDKLETGKTLVPAYNKLVHTDVSKRDNYRKFIDFEDKLKTIMIEFGRPVPIGEIRRILEERYGYLFSTKNRAYSAIKSTGLVEQTAVYGIYQLIRGV